MPDSIARTSFPKILKMHMQRNGMTQKDVAEKMNVTKQSVSEWVNGKKFPRVDKMQQLAELFGVRMSDMYNPSQLSEPSTFNMLATIPVLDENEQNLIRLFRGAEDYAKKIAIETLSNNQKKDSLSKVE